jgi:hypothetical protein
MLTAKPEMTDHFQDGRRRHVGTSSECYEMGNYGPLLMKFGTKTKTDVLGLKIT